MAPPSGGYLIDTTGVWLNWNGYSTTSATSVDITWQAWTSTGTSTYVMGDLWTQYWVPLVETDAQKAARQYAAEQRRLEKIAAQARKEDARGRAELLLLDALTAEQRAEYLEYKHFHVRGRSGRRFRIKCGRAHNIHTVNEDGLLVVEHCAHVGEHVPDEDNILAQKLLIEHDEEAFLRTANSRDLMLKK